VASQGTDHDDKELSLANLLARSAVLKRGLVEFAVGPRCERHLANFKAASFGHSDEPANGEEINVIDRFALQHRLPNGDTVVDRFLASRPDLSESDREMLRAWRDPVEGIFEIRRKDRDSLLLLNLIDDLEYRMYSNISPAVFEPLPVGGFVFARLVPIRPVLDAWLSSGTISAYEESAAAQIAEIALDLATRAPALVYRNPERLKQGWERMRADRAWFMEFFGSDELVLPPTEAQEQLTAYYRHRQERVLAGRPGRRPTRSLPGVDAPAFRFPADLAAADTVGLIYDEIDGLNFYNGYGLLRELFADPTLAADQQYADVLMGYLESETIGPLPFRRLAAAHPKTADMVFREILRKPKFSWAAHGEALMRQRKSWYFKRPPRPGFSPIGARLSELAGC
jgi:hypothetical protein